MRVDRYLLADERRVVAVRRHPAMLGLDAVVAFVVLVAAGTVTGHVPGLVTRLAWLAALAAVGRLAWRLMQWNVDRFVVTDQRVMLVTGVSTRRVAMLPLRRVTDMTYQRSPMGWVFGYGEFIMESAGEAQGLHRIRWVPAPDRLYLEISELMFGRSKLGTAPIDGF